MSVEKRRVQRITLETPFEGQLNKHMVSIIDLSTTGARVEHPTPIPGRKVIDLRFQVDGHDLTVACELVRSRLQRSARDRSVIVYCSGLRFVDPLDDARGTIRELVASLVRTRATMPPEAQNALSVAV